MDQSSHIPPSSGTSWTTLLQLSGLQVMKVQWWVSGKGNPLLASAAMPPVQAVGRRPRSSSDSSLAELGGQQLRQHGDLPGGGRQVRSCLRQTSARQQPWPNFRLIYNFSAMLPLPVQGQECLCLRRNCREPRWITGWYDQALISLKIKTGKGGKGRRPNSFVAYLL